MADANKPPQGLAAAEKPPMGLKPRGAWVEARKVEVMQAMRRYADRGMAVPVEWIDELAELLDLDIYKRR